MPDKKENNKKIENEGILAEKMRQRLHQSYNIECPQSKFVTKNSINSN